jgi:hypothetical protein
MKVRPGPSPRIMHLVNHYRHAVRQNSNDTNITIINNVARADGEPRTMHAFAPNAATGRKVKTLKSGVRRISYR